MIIYTLGTSNRGPEEFIEILKFYNISAVADVRRWPVSQRFSHFKKENLKKLLKNHNILYYHFENLGGYRIEKYNNYMKTENFKKAFKELVNIAENILTCIICAEKFPWKCHRRFISKALEDLGFEVLHIIEKEKIWKPKFPLFLP